MNFKLKQPLLSSRTADIEYDKDIAELILHAMFCACVLHAELG